MNPNTYGHWIFNKEVKTIQWGKRQKKENIINTWGYFK